jgi:RNA polymerase sigma-70 factor (ECF subfamily)
MTRVLARIPPAYREVLTLRFQEDLALEEIAAVIETPISTAKSRLYRGLEALRRLLEREQV